MVGHTHHWQNTVPSAPNAGVFPSSISYTPQGKVCWQPQLSLFVCMRACLCVCVCMYEFCNHRAYILRVCMSSCIQYTKDLYKHMQTFMYIVNTYTCIYVCVYVCVSRGLCVCSHMQRLCCRRNSDAADAASGFGPLSSSQLEGRGFRKYKWLWLRLQLQLCS